TDGADTTFYKDALLREVAPTIPEFMKKVFEDSDIQLSVISFQVSKEEADTREYPEFKQSLKALKALDVDARDSDRLAQVLQRLLLQLAFWADAEGGEAVPGLKAEGHSITRIDRRENPSWLALMPDFYRVRLLATRSLRQQVFVGPGDSLLLEMVEGK